MGWWSTACSGACGGSQGGWIDGVPHSSRNRAKHCQWCSLHCHMHEQSTTGVECSSSSSSRCPVPAPSSACAMQCTCAPVLAVIHPTTHALTPARAVWRCQVRHLRTASAPPGGWHTTHMAAGNSCSCTACHMPKPFGVGMRIEGWARGKGGGRGEQTNTTLRR